MVGTCISYHCKVVTVDNLNDIRDVPSLQLQLDGGRCCFGLRRAWLDDHAGGTPRVTRAVLSVLVLRTDPRWSSRGSVLPLAMAAVFPLSVVLAGCPHSPVLGNGCASRWAQQQGVGASGTRISGCYGPSRSQFGFFCKPQHIHATQPRPQKKAFAPPLSAACLAISTLP